MFHLFHIRKKKITITVLEPSLFTGNLTTLLPLFRYQNDYIDGFYSRYTRASMVCYFLVAFVEQPNKEKKRILRMIQFPQLRKANLYIIHLPERS